MKMLKHEGAEENCEDLESFMCDEGEGEGLQRLGGDSEMKMTSAADEAVKSGWCWGGGGS